MPKNSLLVLGMMSGTSADGIDAALVKISDAPPHLKIKLLHHTHQPFPSAIRKEILCVAEQNPLTPAGFSQLHARLGYIYADAALAACKKFRISPRKLDLIANHGQTIFHQGSPVPFLGAKTASTLQLGDASVIANVTGITTVSDFRPADMALGGQGAPLVPFADYLLYRHAKLGRVSLNLGGIANITVIPANAKPQDVFAFDTGPANILIDALIQHFTHGSRRFDKNASFARRGRINNALIYRLMKDPYLKQRPPKSTGREYFGARYVADLLAFARKRDIKPADVLYTVTYFTAESVVDALRRFVLPKHNIHQLIVSGGGAENPLLMTQLKTLLQIPSSSNADFSHSSSRHSFTLSKREGPLVHPDQNRRATRLPRAESRGHFSNPVELVPSSQFGIPAEAKEALAFALMAYETFHRRPSNLPSATGARRPAILGKISYA
jgi:anhydro-N-acetylmuramic acid kinase